MNSETIPDDQSLNPEEFQDLDIDRTAWTGKDT